MKVSLLSSVVLVLTARETSATQVRQRRLQDQTCPDVSALSEADFDLDQYVSKTWFVQKQQVNPYQSENNLFCVAATYNKRDDGRIQVLNSANEGSVDGAATVPDPNAGFFGLCSEQVEGGQLRVGPCPLCFLSFLVYGPYWVVAVASDYSWSIISAGAPNQFRETQNGTNFCTTTTSECFIDINGAGLWLFAREQVANATTIATMETKLTELGIFSGDLKDVTQANCTYPDYIRT